jgi:putative transposase
VRAFQGAHRVRTICRVLGVSPSGFYASKSRPPSRRAVKDQDLTRRIRVVHEMSRGTYGAWRVHAELREEGVRIGRKRIARLMRGAGLEGVSRRKWVTTTVRDERGRPAPDLVQRQFRASGPNELWVADITEIFTVAGRLYLAAVLDVWSRRVVGWSMDTNMRKELVEASLEMAVRQRQPRGVIHHSDQGGQYTSWSFGRRCRDAGIRLSMGSVGDAYDNALMESFFATLETELLDRTRFATKEEARVAVFDFVEGWYNPRRRHSAIAYKSPLQFERTALACAGTETH